ncbi:hypothetical protein F5051DRAFT_443450 [Lentinula edodes]|nr:hypothetical protein F5051DRAFT_443450 [Lentinula edodes]
MWLAKDHESVQNSYSTIPAHEGLAPKLDVLRKLPLVPMEQQRLQPEDSLYQPGHYVGRFILFSRKTRYLSLQQSLTSWKLVSVSPASTISTSTTFSLSEFIDYIVSAPPNPPERISYPGNPMAHSTPTNWIIQFPSTVSSDTDPCVGFSFEQWPDPVQGSGGGAKYMFNVGESTNRAFAPILSTELPFDEFVTERRIPEPIFRNADPTVYGIPITHIYLDIAATPFSVSNVLKRKRVDDDATDIIVGVNADDLEEGHEEPLRKRVQGTKEALDTQDGHIIISDASTPPIPLANLLSTPPFTSKTLFMQTPVQAQEWRAMMVAIMFPRSRGVELPATTSNNSKQSKYAPGEAVPAPTSSSSIESTILPFTSTSTSSPSSFAARIWNCQSLVHIQDLILGMEEKKRRKRRTGSI